MTEFHSSRYITPPLWSLPDALHPLAASVDSARAAWIDAETNAISADKHAAAGHSDYARRLAEAAAADKPLAEVVDDIGDRKAEAQRRREMARAAHAEVQSRWLNLVNAISADLEQVRAHMDADAEAATALVADAQRQLAAALDGLTRAMGPRAWLSYITAPRDGTQPFNAWNGVRNHPAEPNALQALRSREADRQAKYDALHAVKDAGDPARF